MATYLSWKYVLLKPHNVVLRRWKEKKYIFWAKAEIITFAYSHVYLDCVYFYLLCSDYVYQVWLWKQIDFVQRQQSTFRLFYTYFRIYRVIRIKISKSNLKLENILNRHFHIKIVFLFEHIRHIFCFKVFFRFSKHIKGVRLKRL